MDIIQFVPESLIILVAVLGFLGAMIKQAKFIKDEYIPFILIVAGIVFAIFVQGFGVQSVMQGIICAACAVLGSNVIKQGTKLMQGE